MRLRHTVAAGLGAVALALSVAAPAGAATGEFSYTYETPGGPQRAILADPPSRECVTLPGVAEWTPPAHSPRNHTDSTAVVFTGPDCTGDHFSLRPHTGHGSERLKVRSVLFS
ncbi:MULTISPECIES: hypothetical protein [unclassified Streptomyces]|uniref:hypothetical protein n=1 Tax=unclassified Streptomyces TaxID=2593676 RepID=UPI002DDB6B86|nr:MULTISPECIES: hypothetical protein [unclassified Streptomyces]WSA95871.1 hypothetical protein OIE63_33195 [Streptomyces sp. NBC_01795]WSB80288.1 hypothetical protein OHB04_34310 [Streptomyces sp. NBC_01775]WSS40217.1 hypothetical protein OG220_06050 [Streptomyces sp. NBC_01187]